VQAPECHFYRLQVDPHYRPPPPPPPPFVDEGYDSTYSTDRSEASEAERLPKGKLGRLARRRLVSCLRGMRPERGSIARLMALALKHADAADEVRISSGLGSVAASYVLTSPSSSTRSPTLSSRA